MAPMIQVRGLSKQYRIGISQAPYKTLREELVSALGAQLGRLMGKAVPTHETFWALKDVSFDVLPGEVVGIIGRNGAGKSSLLKIISRVTEPTTGVVNLYGRVGSLLEVGTGFHPELTGRENIFLNGAILGMSRSEIQRRFDDIVAFAEVEKFIDTPVKRYSSGMYLRLAFAIAAHLDTEVLLIDEVLAVGDLTFQQKCLNKMSDVTSQGRTVMFVSHNMGAVQRLCTRSILLERGEIVAVGPSPEIVQRYIAGAFVERSEYSQVTAPDKAMNLRRIALVDEGGNGTCAVPWHQPFRFVIDYEVNKKTSGCSVGIALFAAEGACAFVSADFDCHPELLGGREPGCYRSEVEIPEKWLNTGRYSVMVSIADSLDHVYDNKETIVFTVVETENPGSHHGINFRRGVLQPLLHWTTKRL
jgi:lipopolysaccharide transport system ATP-binding protein